MGKGCCVPKPHEENAPIGLGFRVWVLGLSQNGAPLFSMRIRILSVTTIKEGKTIEKDAVHMSMPPTFKARSYSSNMGVW